MGERPVRATDLELSNSFRLVSAERRPDRNGGFLTASIGLVLRQPRSFEVSYDASQEEPASRSGFCLPYFAIPEAGVIVIIHQTNRLHKRIADGGADKFETSRG